MNLRGILQRLRKSVPVRIVTNTRGAAAAEFALITPAILSVFLGTAELSQGVAIDRKVTITARSLSDLVAQSTTISDTDMTNIFNAATAILMPYSTSTLKARVSAVNIDASGNATIGWSSHSNWTAYTPGTAATIPTALKMPNSQLIWGEISYGYTPPVAKYISGTLNLTDQFFARPRQSSTVCRPPTVTVCS
jgi:Flp pilus assembly protein TadG